MQMGFPASIASQDTVQYPISVKIGFQQNSSGTVPKNNASASVTVIYDGTHLISTYNHHFLISATFNQGSPGSQAVKKSATGCKQVEPPSINRPCFFTDKVGSRWKKH